MYISLFCFIYLFWKQMPSRMSGHATENLGPRRHGFTIEAVNGLSLKCTALKPRLRERCSAIHAIYVITYIYLYVM